MTIPLYLPARLVPNGAEPAVTHAAIDYSDYFEVIRRTNNQTCVEHIVSAVATIDRILDIPLMSNPLKALFGLQGLKHDDDFVSVLVEPLGAVQAQNWDPVESTDSWKRFCETVSSGGAGRQIGLVKIPAEVVNYANWIRKEVVSLCPEGMTVEDVSLSVCCCCHLLTSVDVVYFDSALERTTIPSSGMTRPLHPGKLGPSRFVPRLRLALLNRILMRLIRCATLGVTSWFVGVFLYVGTFCLDDIPDNTVARAL